MKYENYLCSKLTDKLFQLIRKCAAKTPLSLFLIIVLTQTGQAQSISQYGFVSDISTYATITGGTALTSVDSSYDDNVWPVASIPFTFTYHGTPFTTIGISPNGYARLGAVANTTYSALTTEVNILSPFNNNLYGLAGTPHEVRYQTINASPSQIFIIQWSNWGFFNSGLEEISFQIRLYEGSNQVQFVYGPSTPSSLRDMNVGINGDNTTDFNIRTSTTSWSASTPAATNASTITFSNTVTPMNGQTYTWTPPAPCSTPVAVTTSKYITACGNSPVALNAHTYIHHEDFNAGNFGTYTQNTFPNQAYGSFQNYAEGYTYNYSEFFHTPDASAFVMVNNAGEYGLDQDLALTTTAPFSTVGYAQPAIAISHVYKSGGFYDYLVMIQASTDSIVWNNVADIKAMGDHGLPAAFAQDTFSLPAFYMGQPKVYLRLRYYCSGGWYWAINKIEVIDGNPTGVPAIWTPNKDLYTDAAGTIPYTGTPLSTVYAQPSSDMRYTAAYTNVGACNTSGTISTAIRVTGDPLTLAGMPGTTVADTVATIDSFYNIYSMITIRDQDCSLLLNITPSGTSPVTGMIAAKVTEDDSVHTYLSLPYATRHYTIEPAVNPNTATADITLYFKQSEFAAYNAYLLANNLDTVYTSMPVNAGDVVGRENLRIMQYHGAGTAPGNYSGSTVTLIPSEITYDNSNNWWSVKVPVTGFSGFYLTTGKIPRIAARAYLQGAMRNDTMMRNDLQNYNGNNSGGLLPVIDPFGLGTIYADINDTAGAAGKVVDWVLVQVRQGEEPAVILQTRVLLLQPDGHIVDADGSVPKFNSQQLSVRISITNRNHLMVLSDIFPSLSSSDSLVQDFSSSLSQAYNPDPPFYAHSPQQMVQVNGKWCLWAGDVNGDLIIDNVDAALTRDSYQSGPFDVYDNHDLDMDGAVVNTDYSRQRFNYVQGVYSILINY